jgi:hypothetical protein
MPIGRLPLHVLPGRSHILRGSGFMVNVASIDVGAVIEQEGGDLDRGREMEWELTVAAACVDEGWIGSEQLADAVDHAEPGGSVDVDASATRDEVFRKFGACGVENAEATGPPARTFIDVGAGVEQRVDDLTVSLGTAAIMAGASKL